MVVDGTEYGEVRQYGNFSFARIYESGHEIPYYQRKSSPIGTASVCWSINSKFVLTEINSGGCVGLLQPYSLPL
jgi:hypothetical protein